jgi:hypothetical protein
MNKLELAWSAWRALGKVERAQFLVLLREAYCREREVVVRANGGGAPGARVSSLRELTLSEAELGVLAILALLGAIIGSRIGVEIDKRDIR